MLESASSTFKGLVVPMCLDSRDDMSVLSNCM
jgi:hypothetical protein